MNTDEHRFLKILFLILLCAFPAFAQNKSAVETVKSFYKFHNSRSTVFDRPEVDLRKNRFTVELYKLFLYELEREAEYLKKHPTDKPFFGDGFPFTPLEECYSNGKEYLNRYKITQTSVTENKAIVEVKFFIPKECEDQTDEKLIDKYRIELVKSKNRWLIGDWIYADGGRLTDTLKREKY